MKINNNLIKVAGMIIFSVAFFINVFSLDIEMNIDLIMEEYIGKSVPGAAVAIVKEGEIVFTKGYGYSDVEEKKPVLPEKTVFEYGSVNKLFVWVSAMQLAEKGELDLNENISSYLPDEVMKKLKYNQPITMLDLMNHTGGFEDRMFDFAQKDMDFLPPLKETIVKAQPGQIFSPREVISYSNYGTALAAYVIKEITGEKFYDYERENIFYPSDMINVSGHPLYKTNPELIKNKAKGYIVKKEGLFQERNWIYVPAYPSGAADGTVVALAKFALALTPEKAIESPLFETSETFKQMFSKSYAPDEINTSVAHGFWEFDGEVPSFGHGGNTDGFTSFISVSPEKRMGLVVLLNSGTETNLIYELQELVFGKIKYGFFEGLEDPDPEEVSGRYLPSRAAHNNFLEIFSYLSSYEIEKTAPGEIRLLIPGHQASYIQVSPYKYNIYDSSSLVIKYLYPELLFEFSDGEIKRGTSGNSVDLVPLSAFRSWGWVNTSVVILLSGSFLLFLNPLILFIYNIKKGKAGSKLFISMNILGLTLVINNIFLIFTAFNYLYYSSQRVLPYIYGNIAISLISVLLIVLLFLKIEKFKEDNFLYRNRLIYSFVFLLMIFVLFNWNFMKIF